MAECHQCGGKYQQLSKHWISSDCSFLKFSNRQWEILEGLMYGDARLVNKDGRNCYVSVSNTKKEFLKWFDREMGVLSTGVKEHGEPSENEVQAYTCSTRTHPDLDEFLSWYNQSVKKPPEKELSPLSLKCWYVCDGTVNVDENRRPTARISSRKSDEVKERFRKIFVYHGFDPTWSYSHLVFNCDETEKLLDRMGEPLPGFQYKWPESPDLDNSYSMPTERQWKDRDLFYEKRYEESMSYDKISDLWDCSTATVHRWDRKHGFV